MTDTNDTSPARATGPTYREVRAALVRLSLQGVSPAVVDIVAGANYKVNALNVAAALTELRALQDNGEVTLSTDVGGNIVARFDGIILVFPDGRRGILVQRGRSVTDLPDPTILTDESGEDLIVEVVGS